MLGSTVLEQQAWLIATEAVVLRSAAIFLIGSLPALFALGLYAWRRTRLDAFSYQVLRRRCHLVACVVCLYSFGLVADVYRLERDGETSLEMATCTVSEPPHALFGLRCGEGGWRYQMTPPLAASLQEGGRYQLRYFRVERRLVTAEPLPMVPSGVVTP